MTYARRNREYLSGAVGSSLAVLPYDEETVEHQSSDIVVVGMLGICRSWLKCFGLDLCIRQLLVRPRTMLDPLILPSGRPGLSLQLPHDALAILLVLHLAFSHHREERAS